jgi:2'-5' RNA ligase
MTEIASDFAEAWRRFQNLDSLVLSTETIEWEWTRGRTDYAALLVRITDAGVRREIERALRAVEGIPGVEPYPQEYWHATVKGLGFVVDNPAREDEISPARLDELAELSAPIFESSQSFDAIAGPPAGFSEVVILEVHDGGRIRALNQQLLAAIPGLLRTPVDGAIFLPHISIARFTSDDGLARLKQTLSKVRRDAGEGARFNVAEIQLIVARLASGGAPTFDVIRTYRLGG